MALDPYTNSLPFIIYIHARSWKNKHIFIERFTLLIYFILFFVLPAAPSKTDTMLYLLNQILTSDMTLPVGSVSDVKARSPRVHPSIPHPRTASAMSTASHRRVCENLVSSVTSFSKYCTCIGTIFFSFKVI